MIEATIDLSFTDRVKAELAVLSGNIGALMWFSLFPVCGVLLLILTPRDWLDLSMACACFAFVPLAFLARTYRGYATARKNGPFIYRFTSDGFEVKASTAELKLSWVGVPRIRIRLGFLLIYCNKRAAYPLPLRLIGVQQVQSVFALAKAGGAQRVGT